MQEGRNNPRNKGTNERASKEMKTGRKGRGNERRKERRGMKEK